MGDSFHPINFSDFIFSNFILPSIYLSLLLQLISEKATGQSQSRVNDVGWDNAINIIIYRSIYIVKLLYRNFYTVLYLSVTIKISMVQK